MTTPIRGETSGRKKWLSCGSDLRLGRGGTRAAIMSLLESARMCGLIPEAYPCHVLGVIADHPATRVAEPLSWAVASLPSRLQQT